MKRSRFIVILLIQVSICISNIHADSLTTSKLTDLSGSFHDPFRSIIYYPYIAIPELNRNPLIIRGLPHLSTGFYINGIAFPLTTTPFFFDGYRSWFNGNENILFTVSPSFAPIQNGTIGGVISLQPIENADSVDLKAHCNQYDCTFGVSVPIGMKNCIYGTGRYGYNEKGIEQWMDPYVQVLLQEYEKPYFFDFSSGFTATIAPLKSVFNGYLKGAFERVQKIQYRDSIVGNLIDSKNKNFMLGAFSLESSVKDNLLNTLSFGIHQIENRSINPGVNSQTSENSFLHFNDIITYNVSNDIDLSTGVTVKNGNIESSERVFSFVATPRLLSGSLIQLAPFAAIEVRLHDLLLLYSGVRYDSYFYNAQMLYGTSDSEMPIDSSSHHVSYRGKIEISITDAAVLTFFSGMYNQFPPLDQGLSYPLITIDILQSSKHGCSIEGNIGNKVGYDITAYYHRLWNLPRQVTSNLGYGLLYDAFYRSKGIECALEYNHKIIQGLVSYNLGLHETYNYPDKAWARTDYDRRHKIAGHVTMHLPLGFSIGSGGIFSTGVPVYSTVGMVENENSNSVVPILGPKTSGDSYFSLNAKIRNQQQLGPISLEIYAEGWDLLNGEIDEGYDSFYMSGKPIQNIDIRTFAFGATITY